MIDHATKSIPHRIHGGADALGSPRFDFSTNSNACGPCPSVQEAVSKADASRYPDANYTQLRVKLAQFHRCEAWRIVIATSASEFIFRITSFAKLRGVAGIVVPPHSYGDYAYAAKAWGLPLSTTAQQASLIWHCQPSSPLGQINADQFDALPNAIHVVDLAYAPLNLGSKNAEHVGRYDTVWQLHSPNKALGLTGVRAAYAIAPLGSQAQVKEIVGLAASWPLGAHGVALLTSWVSAEVQSWLCESLKTLRLWKLRQISLFESLGWICQSSDTPFFCATPRLLNSASDLTIEQFIEALRNHEIKVRDTSSFGLSGQIRVSVQTPEAQDAMQQACHQIIKGASKDIA